MFLQLAFRNARRLAGLCVAGACLSLAALQFQKANAQTATPVPFKLINKDILLPSKQSFDSFAKGYDRLFVVSVAGALGTGKSTLLNKVYAQLTGTHFMSKQPFSTSNVPTPVGHTLGFDAIILPMPQEESEFDKTLRKTNPAFNETVENPYKEKLGLLLIDAEGLWAGTEIGKNKSDVLLWRLSAISNVVIFNELCANKLAYYELSRLDTALKKNYDGFGNRAEENRRPHLIIFEQRATKPLESKPQFMEYFPGAKFPDFLFSDFSLRHSKLTEPSDKDGLILNTKSLESRIKQLASPDNEGSFSRNPALIWKMLNLIQEASPPSIELDSLPGIDEGNCPHRCVFCHKECARSAIIKHPGQHWVDFEEGCRSHGEKADINGQEAPKVVTYKCRKCAESPNMSVARAPSMTKTKHNYYFYLFGEYYKLSCKVHPEVNVATKKWSFWDLGLIDNPEEEKETRIFKEHYWQPRAYWKNQEPKHKTLVAEVPKSSPVIPEKHHS